MTNYDYIKSLPKEKLAELLVYSKSYEDWDYDYEENPYFMGMIEEWYHPFCKYYFSCMDEALEDCIKCLDKKFKGVYNDK